MAYFNNKQMNTQKNNFARYIYNENNRTQFSLFVNNKTLTNKNDNVNKTKAQQVKNETNEHLKNMNIFKN